MTLVCCLAVGGQPLAQTVVAGRIQVLGHGSVERTPNYAVVQVGIANKATAPTAALDENSAIAAHIIAFAKNFGVDARDLKTAAVNLSPVTKSVREPNGAYRQVLLGSMLIVAWVMSDPVNCELMGRLVMHRLSPFAEMTYVC
jgi:uncharacterized protein YggE